MKFQAIQIAQILNGQVEGDPQATVNTLAGIEEATEGAIAFLSNKKYEPYLYKTKASIVIIDQDLILKKNVNTTLIKVPNAYEAFSSLLKFYEEQIKVIKVGKEQPCFSSESSTLGKDLYQGAFSYIGENTIIEDGVKIYPHVYIGDNCVIGADTILYSGSKVYHDTIIGKNCIIHSGAVIGSDGFGFAPNEQGEYNKIPQLGKVIIGDQVEIGANTTIDRATMTATEIKSGTKLDNLIQVGHNVEIGHSTVIASQTGISGSSKIGDQCMIGGQVGVAGHIKIGNQVKVGAQSGINRTLKNGVTVMGSPAYNIKDYFKVSVVSKSLPEMQKKLKELEKKISNLATD